MMQNYTASRFIYIYIHMYMYIYIYMCVCMLYSDEAARSSKPQAKQRCPATRGRGVVWEGFRIQDFQVQGLGSRVWGLGFRGSGGQGLEGFRL